MPKISQLPSDVTPATSDYVAGVQASVPGTVRFLLSNLITLFWTLANIPTGATSPITRDNETQFAFVASGMVWSGDSYAVNKNASMTAGVCYINGRRISIAAVTARTFTASVDTYIDVLDNLDGTGTLVYTTALNNAASPVLAANSLRVGIIISGATTIAAATSVNQGQETMILPIASSIAYSVTDSLGNLICPRDPGHRVLGYRQIIADFTNTTANALTDITGLNVPVNIPTGRKVKITIGQYYITSTGAAGTFIETSINDVTAAAEVTRTGFTLAGVSWAQSPQTTINTTPPVSGARTYKAQFKTNGAGTYKMAATAATDPAFILVELV